VRVRATIAYDGTDYGGFQLQSNARTIQGEIERALLRITGTPIRILAAGRTDAGVHAEGQVIAFDTTWRHGVGKLRDALNALLPDSIAVFELSEAEPSFHPRYDALSRCYRYTIYQAEVCHPLYRRYSLCVTRPVDLEAMRLATRAILGEHDFGGFGTPPQGDNSVRRVLKASWSQEGPWLYFDIEANAFLYRMVRMLVGTLLRVGHGALSPEAFAEVLVTQDRRRSGPAAPARGLCLKAVRYPTD